MLKYMEIDISELTKSQLKQLHMPLALGAASFLYLMPLKRKGGLKVELKGCHITLEKYQTAVRKIYE